MKNNRKICKFYSLCGRMSDKGNDYNDKRLNKKRNWFMEKMRVVYFCEGVRKGI